MASSAEIDSPRTAPDARHPHQGSLFWRVGLTNAAVLAAAVLSLALSPATVSFPLTSHEALVLIVGALGVIVIDLIAVRRALLPVLRLSKAMRSFDPLTPRGRLGVRANCAEVVELTEAFDDMLVRLETERRESTRRVLAAQEGERRRIAHELHDDIGQSLTFLLLQLDRVERERTPDALGEAKRIARGALGDVRRVAIQLRPESLDDLGLSHALQTLAERTTENSGLLVTSEIDPDLPRLDPETDVAIYRIVQESLTNAVRHANATMVCVQLALANDHLVLRVEDDGQGSAGGVPAGGMQGMRERALSVGGTLTTGPSSQGGFAVRLEVPLRTP